MFDGDRKVYNHDKNENQKTIFLQHFNTKTSVSHPYLVSKRREEENNFTNQFLKNDFGQTKKTNTKKLNFDIAKADLTTKKATSTNPEFEMSEKLNENNSDSDEYEVKYIIINNKNINLGMSTKLQSKIDKTKSLKKNQKNQIIRFQTNKKNTQKRDINFMSENIIELDEQTENQNSYPEKNKNMRLRSYQNKFYINTNSSESSKLTNKSKNKFIVNKEEKQKIRNDSMNTYSDNNTNQNNNIIDNKKMNCQENTKQTKENEIVSNSFKIEGNENSHAIAASSNVQDELRNLPQIFESQNPGITISGIEYTTLLVPKMCVEKLKSILFA